MTRGARIVITLVLVLGVLAALYWIYGAWPLLPSRGGGQTEFAGPRAIDPADVALPDGYRIELVAEGLSFPTDVTFDDDGVPYVIEAGYSYGEVITTPRLLRVTAGGQLEVVATGDNGPWNGVTFHDGTFFVAGGTLERGAVLRVERDGSIAPVVDGLPSLGDHHTNAPAIGPDGLLYFGQGTATNAGVVGTDNADFGWLPRYPDFHDTPCEDVTLAGQNYTSDNPLTEDTTDAVTTGAFLPFGTASESGQRIPGALPCNGAVMRVAPEGGELELVAWGFRNPYGLSFSPSGQLYVVNNSYDQRGSRPVYGTGDQLWLVEEGGWYGWPDFHGAEPLSDENQFAPAGYEAPGTLFAEPPSVPPEPVAKLAVHSSSNGMDFSFDQAFGHVGEAFIAQFGDMSPGVGKVVDPVGFRVVRVNVESGVVEDFAINVEPHGPASLQGNGGLERPISAKFDPSGQALYVVDFGVMTIGEQGPEPREGTGVLWRIVPDGGSL